MGLSVGLWVCVCEYVCESMGLCVSMCVGLWVCMCEYVSGSMGLCV
jgi:hypothetical protein